MTTTGQVTWERLRLQGFGRFAGPVAVELAPGANVLVAANEEGKSTLAAGLVAVLFGLDGGNDPARFSEGRFRNWDAPAPFRGELIFAANGNTYAVRRDFAERSAVLLQREESGWKRLAGGKHHATARRAAASFEDALGDIIGIRDRELFANTYYLRQPLPEPAELDSAVQGLLSGSGGGFEEALGQLEDQLRAVTRHTASLGVTPRDARDERRLEKVRGEMAHLVAESEQQEARVDGLQRLQIELAAARTGEAVAAAAFDAAQRLDQAWQAWLRWRTNSDATARAIGALESAIGAAQDAERELAAARAALAAFPEWGQLPADAGAQLAGLQAATAEASRVELRLSGLQDEIRTSAATVATLADAVARDEPLAGRPGLAAEHALLVSLAARRRQLLARRDECLARRAADEQALAAGEVEWEQAGPGVEARLGRLAVEARWLLERWRELAVDLQTYLAASTAAAPDLANLADLPAGQAEAASTAVDRRADLVARQAAVRARRIPADEQTAFAAGRWLCGGAGAVAGGIAAYLGWSRWAGAVAAASSMPLAVAGGAAVGALFALGLRWFSLLAAARRALDAEAQAFEGSRGPVLAALPDPGSAVQRWRDAAADLAMQRTHLAAACVRLDLATPAELASDAADSLAVGEDAVSPQPSLIDRLMSQPVPASGAWQALLQVAALTGYKGQTAGGLLDWLAGHDESWWAEAVRAAGERERLLASLQEAAGELARIGGTGETPQGGELGQVEGEMAALRSAMRGINETTAPDAVRQMQRKHQADREQLAAEQARHASLAAEAKRGAASLAALTTRANELRVLLAPLLDAIPGGDAGAAARRLAAARAASDAVAAAGQKLQGIVRGAGAQDLTSLRAALVQRAGEMASIAGAWQQLVTDNPALPPPAAAADALAVDAQAGALARRRDACRDDLAAASQRLRGLEREAARLEGAGGDLNLAQAASRLAELRAEEAELVFQSEAIAQAHRELRAAVQEYQDAHRDLLARGATGVFDRLAGGSGRRVDLDERFSVSVRRRDGATILPSQLSQGARDQLYVALRIAIADLLADRVGLPVLFDDPFLTFDPARLRQMQAAFCRLAAEGRQVWLLTHRPEYATWGRAATIRELDSWPGWEGE